MPVDKFGRNGDRTTTVYTGINKANLTNCFLRRDRGNTAFGTIDMNSHIIKNVAEPWSNQDVANQELCRQKERYYYRWQCCVCRYKIKCWFETWLGVQDVMILLQIRSLHVCWGQTQICQRIQFPFQDYQCLSR